MGDKIQQVAVTTDDRIGLPGHGQCQELVVIPITRSPDRCSRIFVPQRQLDQRDQERVPALRFAVMVELGPVQTRHQFIECRLRHQYVDVVIQNGIHQLVPAKSISIARTPKDLHDRTHGCTPHTPDPLPPKPGTRRTHHIRSSGTT